MKDFFKKFKTLGPDSNKTLDNQPLVREQHHYLDLAQLYFNGVQDVLPVFDNNGEEHLIISCDSSNKDNHLALEHMKINKAGGIFPESTQTLIEEYKGLIVSALFYIGKDSFGEETIYWSEGNVYKGIGGSLKFYANIDIKETYKILQDIEWVKKRW